MTVEVETEDLKAGGGDTTWLSKLWILRLLMLFKSELFMEFIEGIEAGSLAENFKGEAFSLFKSVEDFRFKGPDSWLAWLAWLVWLAWLLDWIFFNEPRDT